MKKRFLYLIVIVSTMLFTQCGKPAADKVGHDAHEEEDVKIQLTVYTDKFEFFAESDPLVVGKECSLLAHFTHLPGFKPLLSGRVTLSLTVDGQTASADQTDPIRPGIYRFTLVPKTAGRGRLTIGIAAEPADTMVIDDLVVYKTEEEALEAHEAHEGNPAQTVTFTKENSWKVDFATALPQIGAFGEVIKTAARIEPAQGDEATVTAKTQGVVRFSGESVLEGKRLAAGQSLFSISGGGLADNNAAVRYAEARNNYQRAKADYERAADLAKDRIVSEKELLGVKNEYENAKAVFDNLQKNFAADGQIVTSPFAGFVKRVFVRNGQHVEAGEPLVTVSQNKKLILRADIRQKYAPILGSVVTANVRTLQDNATYTLEQLNGRILSYGQSVNDDNFLIPVSIQIDNTGGLLPGGFVELYLKTAARAEALSVPDTAILEDQGHYYVFVQINPEQFEKREVKIGAGDGLLTEILTGITEKERIVSKGAIWVKLAQASGALDAHSGHVH